MSLPAWIAAKCWSRKEKEAQLELYADHAVLYWKNIEHIVRNIEQYSQAASRLLIMEGQGRQDLQSVRTAVPVLFEIFAALLFTTWKECRACLFSLSVHKKR